MCPLGLEPTDCWITDLVKVFLYKKEHFDSCKAVVPDFKVQVLRDRFWDLGNKSLKWIRDDIQLCKPKVIVTLGLEVAQVVSGKRSAKQNVILKSNVANPENLNGVPTVYAPHPDACRRFEKCRKIIKDRVGLVREWLNLLFQFPD